MVLCTRNSSLTGTIANYDSANIVWNINSNRRTFRFASLINTHITITFTRYGYQLAKFTKIPRFLISITSYHDNIYKKFVFNVRQSMRRYWKYWLRYELKREDTFSNQKSAIMVTFTRHGYQTVHSKIRGNYQNSDIVKQIIEYYAQETPL